MRESIALVLVIIFFFHGQSSCRNLTETSANSTSKVILVKKELTAETKKINIIIQYEIKTRKKLPIAIIQLLHVLTTGASGLFLAYRPKDAFGNPSNFIEEVGIFTFLYCLAKLALGSIDLIIKKQILHSYSSYRNGLTIKELRALQETLKDNPTEEKIREVLLKFINTSKIPQANYLNIDPIRWVFSSHLSHKTRIRFNRVKKKSNRAIIEEIIKNYELNNNCNNIYLNWSLMTLNFIRTMLFLSSFIRFNSKPSTYKDEESWKNIQFFIFCSTIILPMCFTITEFQHTIFPSYEWDQKEIRKLISRDEML